MIARESRISLMIDGKERHFTIHSAPEKYQAYEFLVSWMRTLPPPDLTFAINDLCKRYSVDLAGLSRSVAMDWDDLAKLAADPNVTIGSATVNYPVLSSLRDADAQREMAMGKAVAEAAFHRDVRHFAYPFGDRDAWRSQHVAMAEEIGFASAAIDDAGRGRGQGLYQSAGAAPFAWDGRQRSLRMMRVMLSGASFAPVEGEQGRVGESRFTRRAATSS